MKLYRHLAVCLSLSLLGTTASAQVPTSDAAPIRIGLITPLTGGSSDFGTSMFHGASLAVSDINSVGGYLGRKFELVVRDDKSTPDLGRAAAEDLVTKEKVLFTIGFCNTGVAMKALEVFEANKHVLMVPCATGTGITRTTPAAQSFVFRLAPPDRVQAPFLVREAVDRRKLTRVALFADRTGYGEAGLKELVAGLEKRGLKPVYVGRFDIGVQSLREEMEAARAAGADAIIGYTVGPEHAVALKSRSAIGWRAPYFAPWTSSFSSVLKLAGPAAVEGAVMVQSIIQDTANERRSSFIARYARQSNERPIGSLMAAAQSYDSVHLMLRALFQTKGDFSGPALKSALENLREPYRGVITTFDKPFSAEDHDAFTDNMVWLGEWRNGSISYYYAEDAKLSSVMRRKAD